MVTPGNLRVHMSALRKALGDGADGVHYIENVTGQGYAKTGTIESVAGVPVPDFTRLALGLALDTDATVLLDRGDTAVVATPPSSAGA